VDVRTLRVASQRFSDSRELLSRSTSKGRDSIIATIGSAINAD
jgi:hypothetical protein